MRAPAVSSVALCAAAAMLAWSSGLHAEPSGAGGGGGKALPSVQPPVVAEPEIEDETEDDLEAAEEESSEGTEPSTDGTGVAIGKAPATRYGKMSSRSCLREVAKRKLPITFAGETRGVPIPVRIHGALHGVEVHSGIPKSQRSTSPYEIVDCRLALAIDDFTALLAKHDVVEVVHMSAYRPPSKKWPAGKPGKRHGAALALDAAVFVKKDGTKLSVEKSFKGHRHSAPCSVSAKAGADTKELRALFCEAREEGLFHVMLSPNFNWAHRNHFHLEVAAHPRWFYVR